MSAVQRLARLTRETTASLAAHLAEMETRGLHLGAGYPSLFVYCTDVLRLSEHETYLRIEAARLARRFPLVLEMLEDGSLTLTTARLLSPNLTAENHHTLLAAAAGRSKREVAVLLARMFPLPDVPTSMRKVPTPRATPTVPADGGSGGVQAIESADAAVSGFIHGRSGADVPASGPSAPVAVGLLPRAQPPSQKARELVRPLAADRYEVRFTIGAAGREKLRLATDLLRHAVPDGDVAEIIDRALTVLLEDLARKKFAATPRPASGARQVRGAARRTRHVPAQVKRVVWLRDGGRCAFVGKGGRRCREGGFLELHHVRPYAAGGQATVENIELRCRAHNGYEAELFYGGRFLAATTRNVSFSDNAGASELGPDQVAAGVGCGVAVRPDRRPSSP